MPRPPSGIKTERTLSIDDLSLQPLSPHRDTFTPPPNLLAPNEIRRRISTRPEEDEAEVEPDTPIKAQPGHRSRASSDVAWSRNFQAFGDNADASSTAFDKSTARKRPPIIRNDTNTSAIDPLNDGVPRSRFKDPFSTPKALLLRKNPFNGHKEEESSDNASDARGGYLESETPPSSASSVDEHRIVSQCLSLTDDDVQRFERDRKAYEEAKQKGREEDLGAQAIPEEEKAPFRPDFKIIYPTIEEPKDPARVLKKSDLRKQRTFFFSIVIVLNIAALLAAIFAGGTWVFVFILFVKSKDCLSVVFAASGLLVRKIYRLFVPRKPVEPKWILTLIPAYSESEEQIVKTIFSLRDNDVEPHMQVMCVILDGKHRNVKKHMTRMISSFKRPYVTSKFKLGELIIDAGFMENVPVICIEKVRNSGKKDSLILCHDLFNVIRENAPLYTKLLRKEIWTRLLPTLTGLENFSKFDMVFCTDADSTIYKGAVASLANAIARSKNAIAACGLVLVELEEGYRWSRWNLYQQFQYTFGQYVRRRAEGMYGKVTCLPGCITMIAVRPEMAGAIRKYAEPITAYPVILHQVQYLGTDRRLTYSMLSQDTKLKTLFVPEAVSETVAPQSLQHYLSQRRRWGSNAYFNNYFYCFGEKMTPVMRLAASIELVRLTMVYYRIANTVMFVYSLTKRIDMMRIIPLLVVSQLPTVWFMFCALFVERELQKRVHKLALGFLLNKLFSPFLSLTIFTKVVKNLGSQVWGMTGGANAIASQAQPPPDTSTSTSTITPSSSTTAPQRGTVLPPAQPSTLSLATTIQSTTTDTSAATSFTSGWSSAANSNRNSLVSNNNRNSVLSTHDAMGNLIVPATTAAGNPQGANRNSTLGLADMVPGASATAIALGEPPRTVVMETMVEGILGEQLANLPDEELAEEEANEKLAGAEEPIPPF